jgi:trk system potassium uptake protein TrkH
MNFRLLARLLGILSVLIGFFMLLSLFWAYPNIGRHTDIRISNPQFEWSGFQGLLASCVICWALGGLLWYYGRDANGKIYRKEAMAVVGLSWVVATLLGAFPYILSGTCRGPSIRIIEQPRPAVLVVAYRPEFWRSWELLDRLEPDEFKVLKTIVNARATGVAKTALIRISGVDKAEAVFGKLRSHRELAPWLIAPGEEIDAPADRSSHFRMRWMRMGLIDSMFEAQSGFSTTGATVLCELEDPQLVPRCILFWRASTHFLGGLGIIVLFVVLLGQGSAGKALMLAEMPGPTQENIVSRMQHTAWLFAAIYVALNLILIVILKVLGMSMFDSICHSFATMATGGFSTYNASLGHFARNLPDVQGQAIEYVVIIFMILAGTNFTLLFLVSIGQPGKLLADPEWRTYIGIMAAVTGLVVVFGFLSGGSDFDTLEKAFRNSAFQVVSVMTTTGFGTCDFDSWSEFSRSLLLFIMFIGGCAGSTAGGLKVIRCLLVVKILGIEIEQSFRPKVVGVLRLGGKPVDEKSLRHSILVYFTLVAILVAISLLFVMMTEPKTTWGIDDSDKLLDSSSAVISTLNNIGPGLGIVGATQNYSNFSFLNKTLFIWLMMLGRLEVFPILVLFMPGFWRDH